MLTIKMKKRTGAFAENKDIARELRVKQIIPAIDAGETKIILDFDAVTGATQSFIHALISDLIRNYGSDIFNKIFFKNCNATIQQIINIVADYMEASYE